MSVPPLRIHPENPKLLQFRGRPVVLVGATEHYGSVMNRPFDFVRYLAEAHDKAQTITRLFTLFRELQLPNNPYSPCKPESPDYISPFRRVGPDRALDGELKYDLTQWNPEFFERLHRFLSLASDYGIIVEITLLSDTYCEPVWQLNPLHHHNNINDVEVIRLQDYLTQRHAKLFACQCAYVRKIVTEVNRYDNVFFEICNEPSGQEGVSDPPPLEEVDAWQEALAGVIRDAEAKLPHQHLIAGEQAFMNTAKVFELYAEKAFSTLSFDIVNVHPASNMIYRAQSYDMGPFMQKKLCLRPLRDYCLATYRERKPLNLDEDNIASQYKDEEGWTIHRKRAWMTLFCGAHYDYIDFSIINYCEAGTESSRQGIRSWMKHLAEFIHSLNLHQARPRLDIIKQTPPHTLAAMLATEPQDYCCYLADERELDENAGQAIQGNLILELPVGDYQMACYHPVTGHYSPWVYLKGSQAASIALPLFHHDIVVRIRHIAGDKD